MPKIPTVPPYLYKFATAKAAKAILQNGTLRWSAPAAFNDPFDMQFGFQSSYNKDYVIQKSLALKVGLIFGTPLNEPPLNKLGKALYDRRREFLNVDREDLEQHFRKSIEQSLDEDSSFQEKHRGTIFEQFHNSRVLCLTEDPTNIVMWAHYAADHAGAVLRFNTTAFNGCFSLARPVDYCLSMPNLHSEDELALFLAGYGPGGFEPARIMEKIVYTKANCWAYEREWRLYAGDGRQPGQFEYNAFGSEDLDGIIFGARTATTDCRELTQLLLNYGSKRVWTAQLKNNEFALEIIGGDESIERSHGR